MSLEAFSEFFAKLSFTEGVLLLLVLCGGFWIYKIYAREAKHYQRELDRLAADNHDYRDRFETMQNTIESLTKQLGDCLARSSTKPRTSKKP